MSEEEKKAIEYWKRDIEFYHCNTQLASEHYAQIILNLIEKQQKELEQEKEKNKGLETDNIDLKKKNRLIAENLSRSYISKDKIKEKIKELKEEIKLARKEKDLVIVAELELQVDILKQILKEK